MIERMPRSISSLFSAKSPHAKRMAKILLGLLCAAPVVAWLTLYIKEDGSFDHSLGVEVLPWAIVAGWLLSTLIMFSQ